MLAPHRLFHSLHPRGLFLTLVVLLTVTGSAWAGQVTLAWDDPDNDPAEVEGYILYYWQPGWGVPESVDVGKQRTYTLTGLDAGQTYHFAITTYYGHNGTESAYSNVVSAVLEAIAHEETKTGGATRATTVRTANNLTRGSGHLYLAAIATKPPVAVSAVSGLGLTWTPVRAQCSGRNATGITVWMGPRRADP